MENTKCVTVIGAGIAGCYLSILLAAKGYAVDLYEKSTEEEIIQAASRRSYNLTFFGFGIKALKKAGLWDDLASNLILLKGSKTQVSYDTEPIFTKLDEDSMPYYCISRASLINTMFEKIKKMPEISLHCNTKLTHINKMTQEFEFVKGGTNVKFHKKGTVIIGADGVHSKVREQMHIGQKYSLTEQYSDWTYKQLFFTKADVEKLGLESNIAYTWTRKNASILEFPNTDKTAVAMFVLPTQSDGNFVNLTNAQKIEVFIQNEFPALLPSLPSIITSLLNHPEGKYVTIHTQPWYSKNFIAILGDAAHGFMPFFGQGMSAAFGDCITLVSLLDEYSGDWGKVFPEYERVRKRNMDALGELSKEGFERYRRENRADTTAIYEKLEEIGNRLFPNHILPPLFVPITHDPDHTADHLEKYLNQKKRAEKIGIFILVDCIRLTYLLKERMLSQRSSKTK